MGLSLWHAVRRFQPWSIHVFFLAGYGVGVPAVAIRMQVGFRGVGF
jgi:hypothetical protein